MTNTILIQGQYSGPASGLVPEAGTLVFDLDTNTLKVGDGSTPGGVDLTGGGVVSDPTFTSVTTQDLTVTGQKMTLHTARNCVAFVSS